MSNASQTPAGLPELLVPGEAASNEQLTIQNRLLTEAMYALNTNYSTTEAPPVLKDIPVFKEDKDQFGNTTAKVSSNLAYSLMQGLESDAQDVVASYVGTHGDELFPDSVIKEKYGTAEQDDHAYKGCTETGKRVRRAIDVSLTKKVTGLEKAQKDALYNMNKVFFDQLYARKKASGSKQTYTAVFGSAFKQLYKVKKGLIVVDSIMVKQCGLRDPLTWSDFTFFAWKRYVEEKKEAGAALLDTLQEVSIEAISNVKTAAAIRACYRSAKINFEHTICKNTWTYKDNPAQFTALLGTPNILGTGWLLADHNDELGGYDIESIITEIPSIGSDWWVTIKFKRVGLPS